MPEGLDEIQEEVLGHAAESRLNGYVALFVSVVATMMALINVKDGNVVQSMQQAQARSIDQWSHYQSKSTKQHLAATSAEMLRVQLDLSGALGSDVRAKVEEKIALLEAEARKHGTEMERIKGEAEQAGKDYEAINVHDDQFDLADACLSVAMALAGVTALTRRRWLFGVAMTFGTIGAFYGLAGFLQWNLHSDLMAKLLG